MFAAEVKFVVLQYMSSVVAERHESESEFYKLSCSQALDMSLKEGNTCFVFVFTMSWQ